MKSANLLQKASFDEISLLINDALKLGSDNSYGYDYKLNTIRVRQTPPIFKHYITIKADEGVLYVMGKE